MRPLNPIQRRELSIWTPEHWQAGTYSFCRPKLPQSSMWHVMGNALNRLAIDRVIPKILSVDEGAELASMGLGEWAHGRRVSPPDFARPGTGTGRIIVQQRE